MRPAPSPPLFPYTSLFRSQSALQTRLQSRGLEAFLQPDELSEQGLVGDPGAEVVGGADFAELFGQLERERRLPGAGGTLDDEGVASRRVEELYDLARDAAGRCHRGTGSTLKRPLYIRFRPDVRAARCRPIPAVSPESGGTAARPRAW